MKQYITLKWAYVVNRVAACGTSVNTTNSPISDWCAIEDPTQELETFRSERDHLQQLSKGSNSFKPTALSTICHFAIILVGDCSYFRES